MLNKNTPENDSDYEYDEPDTAGKAAWDPYAVPDTDTGQEQTVSSNLSSGLPYYKRYRNSVLFFFIIIFVGMMIYGNVTGSGTVSLQISDEAVGVAGPNGTTTIILFEEIVDVACYESFDVGEALDAYDSEDNYEGTYQNDTLGEYSIIAYQKCTSMIVITTNDGLFAFNCSSVSSTEKNYDSLVEALEKWQAAL